LFLFILIFIVLKFLNRIWITTWLWKYYEFICKRINLIFVASCIRIHVIYVQKSLRCLNAGINSNYQQCDYWSNQSYRPAMKEKYHKTGVETWTPILFICIFLAVLHASLSLMFFHWTYNSFLCLFQIQFLLFQS